jgi:anthranilate phosphoribosyltransferase
MQRIIRFFFCLKKECFSQEISIWRTAFTSVCGTVDMAEALGVDVECTPDIVAGSIASAGLGLFNGMSPHIHPNALGRILSRIFFGSTLNIAASLANPALPAVGVRGVYAREMILPVAEVMKEIGYRSAIVLHGSVGDAGLGMDEASVCGTTHCARIRTDTKTGRGAIDQFPIDPVSLGFSCPGGDDLRPEPDRDKETRRFVRLMNNKENSPRKDALAIDLAGTACKLMYEMASFYEAKIYIPLSRKNQVLKDTVMIISTNYFQHGINKNIF